MGLLMPPPSAGQAFSPDASLTGTLSSPLPARYPFSVPGVGVAWGGGAVPPRGWLVSLWPPVPTSSSRPHRAQVRQQFRS